MLVKLTKMSSTHNNVRNNEIIGLMKNRPKVGFPFTMTSEPLIDDASFRYLHTSCVEHIIEISENILEVVTRNSTYRIEFLED